MNFKKLLLLFRNVKVTSFQKGGIIIPENSKEKKLYFIRKGLVRSFLVNDKGDEITFRIFSENQTLTNAHYILLNQPSKFSYQALEQTKAYCIDYEDLIDITAKNESLLALSRSFLGKRILKEAFQRTESFVFLTPEERYKQFLKDQPNVVHRVPDMYIANVLGITPVSLSRIRKRIASQK